MGLNEISEPAEVDDVRRRAPVQRQRFGIAAGDPGLVVTTDTVAFGGLPLAGRRAGDVLGSGRASAPASRSRWPRSPRVWPRGAFRADLPARWLVATFFGIVHAAGDEVEAGTVKAEKGPQLPGADRPGRAHAASFSA